MHRRRAVDVVLKCDLLSGMFEGQYQKPSPVSHSPGRPTLVLMPVTQRKSLKMLTRSRHHLAHDAAQAEGRSRYRVENASSTAHPISSAERARKNANVVNVAIAREMVGFIWSIACTVQSAPKAACTASRGDHNTESASARYAALEEGQCRGALVSTMSLDARHLYRGSPKRNQVMRPDPRMRDC